ncbi:hypothetical protein ASPWEDRAFT_27662 [Aspergillus wentii DTO 134E9]|uniref:Uncharacterized protein n=1 Tax=Aspergillus wentii DTO 134E9 TaxID=1073089 RepID=A0A1L9RJA5_ASPWE|nr:uncharacterized protein ASPWEDRAFT_27662 [Aspergillus wentii DTO 134E9]KAI9932064.1 hypothetical protein MW887_009569 [Aspergillus wentii]OJJ34981.1 hypothetical protein ASPWEDRAFT_27662 [Aspergillus wentii DTO 134E9]
MSSMRNAVQRRQHRERGQLQGREKWGILEKHKDYSLRAKDYNAKKAKLKRLEEKARDRNPDEFAFGMMTDQARAQGKHGRASRDSAAARGLSNEAIKLLKTQDAGYLRTVGERVRREMERVEQEVRLQDGMQKVLGIEKEDKKEDQSEDDDDFDFDFDLDEEDQNKKSRKLVFADDRQELRAMKKRRIQDEEEEDDDEDDDSFGKKLNQKKTPKQLAAERQALVEARRTRKMKKRATEARENKLKSLKKQHADITAAERELDWQRGKMEHSVGGTNKNGIKWKIRERKR